MNIEKAAPDLEILLPEMQTLADQEGVSVDLVRELYRAELEKLKASARILDFVPVLATNRLKRRLRERRDTRPRQAEAAELHGA
jgi:hypothetical protein